MCTRLQPSLSSFWPSSSSWFAAVLAVAVGSVFAGVVIASPFFASIVYADAQSVSVSIITPECSDGIDNDGNSLTDYPDDTGCSDSLDLSEETPTLCSDGVDNDGDGDIDYPDDIGCDEDDDNDEYNEPVDVPGSDSGDGNGRPASNQNIVQTGEVIIRGTADTDVTVFLLVDMRSRANVSTDDKGMFEIELHNVTSGVRTFTLYTEDARGAKTQAYSVTAMVNAAVSTVIEGVALGKSNVKLETAKETEEEAEKEREKALEEQKEMGRAGNSDLNSDGKVNLTDFSIVAFWYKKSNPPERVDVNRDGDVDLVDFSILAFRWTG